jgi:DNA-binding PadR family transcriptional regulator
MTNAELAILSLVVEQPRHGYEIERVIEEREMRAWTDVGFSSIYYLLRKLQVEGLVASRREPAPGRGPSRRVYSVTAAGRDVWQEHVLQALANPRQRPSDFLLGLANLPRLDPKTAAEALEEHAHDLESRLAHIEQRRAIELPFHVAAMFELTTAHLEVELAWIRRFGRTLEEQPAMSRKGDS